MFEHLDIYSPRERVAVGLADLGLRAVAAWPRRRPAVGTPRRILLLRLERIGDLLMSIGAIRAVRRAAPDARIDLVVGSWNEPIARLLREVDEVEILDAPWLARNGRGSMRELVARASRWRARGYDLAINFEGDIRSNLLPWIAGAPRRVGFVHAGGGPLLTDRVAHDPRRHVADGGLRLVERAFAMPAGALSSVENGTDAWRLSVPEQARAAASRVLESTLPGGAPIVAVHVGAGRVVKQWPPERFGEAAAILAREHGVGLLFTGTPDEAALADAAMARARELGAQAASLSGGTDLVLLAAVLEQCRLLVTGDTGPMHLASAVGTPLVAIFGPSMPWRYGPIGPARVVRIDLPCSPCNRIRRPPRRCTGVVPDCLAGIGVDAVVAAARELLGGQTTRLQPAGQP
ncbi:MAG TPA: glycosyltransferase family 9 protein [Vicinamibacterales bacterium]